MEPPDGPLPFSDVTGLLAAAASAEKQQALVARIFLPRPSDPSTSSSVDQFAQLSSVAKQLKAFVRQNARSVESLDGQDYIWHREPPSISVSSSPSLTRSSTSHLPPHILFHLRTGGECIEDEWFATHLLLRASTELAHLQLCISIEDEDGQFLLIEAAEHLPDWVTPESVVNRVWIFQGHLHLIPPHHTTSEDGSLLASRAVELVADQSSPTRASDDIEAAAFASAFEFPSAAISHHHTTLAYLPRRVAQIVAADPQLIANCVTSVQSRDIVSSRSGSKLVHFPPPPAAQASTTASTSTSTSDNEIVLVPLRMTRHLYAQLLYDRFFPPRQLGPAWQQAVEKYRRRLFRQSPESKIEDELEVQSEMLHGRWHDLGAKIWCGLEMAYTESLARRTKGRGREMGGAQSSIPGPDRERLIASLTKLGYFQGEMEGSAKWKTLESEAIAQYVKGNSSPSVDVDTGGEDLLCDSVDLALRNEKAAPLITLPADASLTTVKGEESDDTWLNLNANDIESILQTKNQIDPLSGSAPAVSEQDTFTRLHTFNSKMEDFLKTKSDPRGAVFQDEIDNEEMLDDDDLLFEDVDEDEQEERVKAQVEERMRTTGEDEKRKLVERLIPRMSEDEWTHKPPVPDEDMDKDDFLSSIDKIAAERSASSQPMVQGREVAMRDNNLSAAHAELQRRLASQYMRETSTLLSSQNRERYNGASDSDEEELEQELSPEIRKQRAAEYGIEPDEPAMEVEGGWEDVAEPEMGDEETEVGNLLEFARISLGLTKEQYEGILEERRGKGKFVPASGSTPTKPTREKAAPQAAKLDSFESVMAAMENQLHHLQASQPPPTTSGTNTNVKAEQNSANEEEEELLAHLLKSGSDLPSSLLSHLGEGENGMQAEQLESFLRSFQAQTGTSGPGSGSGPVEVLMRRFGLGSLPANQDSPLQQ